MANVKELPLEILGLIGEYLEDPVSYGSFSYAVDLRLLQGIYRKKAIDKYTTVEVDEEGTKEWRLNGKYHREGDLPAVIYCQNT